MQNRNKSPLSIGTPLKTPQGVEGVYPMDACRHHHLLRFMEDFFTAWGYLPALTPVFDYFETYSPLLDKALAERSYRFPDRDGEVIMLRSDITLFLARQMGQSLKDSTGPTRVFYADSILRHQDEEDICSAEFFQAGAELLGVPGRDGDLEVVLLLHDLLESMELPDWRIHLGSRSLLNAVLNSGNSVSSPDILATAMHLMDLRDRDALIELLADNRTSYPESPAPEALADMLLYLGKPHEFNTHIQRWQNDGFLTGETGMAINEMQGLVSELGLVSDTITKRLRIDLSEHGDQSYYTGFTVRVYMEGAPSAVASGGRYDGLLGMFGKPRPAAGFSLMTRRIEQLSGYAGKRDDQLVPFTAAGKSFTQRYRDAVARRKQGQRVALS